MQEIAGRRHRIILAQRLFPILAFSLFFFFVSFTALALVSAHVFAAETTTGCDPSLTIEPSLKEVHEQEKLAFRLRVGNKSGAYEISYWIEDQAGNILREKKQTNTTSAKSFTPKRIDASVAYFLIKAELLQLGCPDSNSANNYAEAKIGYIQPDQPYFTQPDAAPVPASGKKMNSGNQSSQKMYQVVPLFSAAVAVTSASANGQQHVLQPAKPRTHALIADRKENRGDADSSSSSAINLAQGQDVNLSLRKDEAADGGATRTGTYTSKNALLRNLMPFVLLGLFLLVALYVFRASRACP